MELRRLKESVEALQVRCDTLEQSQQTQHLVKFYASVKRTPLDLDVVIEKCCDPAYRQDVFCHRELPVILAHMIVKLDNLPAGLSAMKNVATVRGILMSVFSKLTTVAVPQTPEQTSAFIAVVKDLMEEVEPVVQTMAMGVIELRKLMTMHRAALSDHETMAVKLQALYDVPDLQEALDDFYLAFVQFKFLALQLLQTTGAKGRGSDEDVVGIVDTSIDLLEVARSAIHNANLVCNETHGDCPDIDIECSSSSRAVIAHMHDHLSYILVELIKNSLRATIDTHMQRNSLGMIDCDDMPPVKVKILANESPDTATVIVSDQGGGIPREDMSKIMSYTYTSARKSALADGNDEPTLLAGYGYGLPMSRIHARLFGGDILVQSFEGYGTDAYLFLRKKVCRLPGS